MKHCGAPSACAVFLQGNARTLVLMVTSAAIGGTLQYGYNLAIMNAPTVVSKQERNLYLPLFTCECLAIFVHHVVMCT